MQKPVFLFIVDHEQVLTTLCFAKLVVVKLSLGRGGPTPYAACGGGFHSSCVSLQTDKTELMSCTSRLWTTA